VFIADQATRGQGLSRDELEEGDDGPGAAVEQQRFGWVPRDPAPQPTPFEVTYHRIEITHLVSPWMDVT
jgi:hypothetical protein